MRLAAQVRSSPSPDSLVPAELGVRSVLGFVFFPSPVAVVADDGAIFGEREGGRGLPGGAADRVGVLLRGVARAAPGRRDGGRDQGDRHGEAQHEAAGEPYVRDTYTGED